MAWDVRTDPAAPGIETMTCCSFDGQLHITGLRATAARRVISRMMARLSPRSANAERPVSKSRTGDRAPQARHRGVST
ncbi:hypothetical protein AB0958_30625 [Streptomyces sp. NPDC006655]|uniref:hypothetical protein n=1 Tax=Streptomyces sp. NPDC006655 TaxID=3156898 RepID=UPI0034514854